MFSKKINKVFFQYLFKPYYKLYKFQSKYYSFYEVFHLDKNCNEEEINIAYIKLRSYYESNGGQRDLSIDDLTALNALEVAYQILRSKENRNIYDSYLTDCLYIDEGVYTRKSPNNCENNNFKTFEWKNKCKKLEKDKYNQYNDNFSSLNDIYANESIIEDRPELMQHKRQNLLIKV
jgi:DnaJ-class molecular chaperone